MHLLAKKLNLFINTHASLLPYQHNFPPGSCHHPSSFFEKLFTPTETKRKGKETMRELKKWLKLNLWRYRSQVLINPTIFAHFAFLVYAWLCHNWDSSMLKSDFFNKNKNLIKISLKNIVCRNNCMKDETFLHPIFYPFHPPYAKLKFLSLHFSHFNPLMHNFPKWSDTL